VQTPLCNQVGLMAGLGQLRLTVGTDAEVKLPLDPEVGELQLPNLGTQAIVGGENIGGVQRGNGQLPTTEIRAQTVSASQRLAPIRGKEGKSSLTRASMASLMAPPASKSWRQ
jgi:hypothetical protein